MNRQELHNMPMFWPLLRGTRFWRETRQSYIMYGRSPRRQNGLAMTYIYVCEPKFFC